MKAEIGGLAGPLGTTPLEHEFDRPIRCLNDLEILYGLHEEIQLHIDAPTEKTKEVFTEGYLKRNQQIILNDLAKYMSCRTKREEFVHRLEELQAQRKATSPKEIRKGIDARIKKCQKELEAFESYTASELKAIKKAFETEKKLIQSPLDAYPKIKAEVKAF